MAKKLSDRNDPLIVQYTGKRFGTLLAVRFSHIQHDQMWEFECGCGKHFVARLAAVKNGHTKSCGCLLSENLIRRNTVHGYANRGKQSHIYKVWKSMRKRCNNPRSKDFRLYGGKGVKVCDRWQDFFRGETLNVSLWAERFGMDYDLLWQRVNAGWPMEKAVSLPSLRARK